MPDPSTVSNGPTPGQCDILGVLGASFPKTKRDASLLITKLLENPANEMRWRGERARRYVARSCDSPRRAADDPQDSSAVVFGVACVLVQGFGLSTAEARPLLEEYLARSDAPWTSAEISHKLDGALAQGGFQTRGGLLPRGCLIGNEPGFVPNRETKRERGQVGEGEVKKKVEFDAARLAEVAKPWRDTADLLWLANRSARDPALTGAAEFLRALYGEKFAGKILFFTDYFSQGQGLWPDAAPPASAPLGVWFLPQPTDGEYHTNPRSLDKDGKARPSRRSEESVLSYRYLLLESDKAEMRDWLGFIVQAPLKIEALYTSGGRSIHALVRVDCPTKEAWTKEKNDLMPFLMGCVMVGGDRGVLSGVRLSRLPGCAREGKEDDEGRYQRYPAPRLQKLLYLHPGADGRPICELPARQDVENDWVNKAGLAVDGHADNTPELRAGLRYYANVSKPCALALADLEAGA